MRTKINKEKIGRIKYLYADILRIAIFFIIYFLLSVSTVEAAVVTTAGKELAHILDGMDVMDRWLPGTDVNWLTGRVIGYEEGLVTHCSSFVAATAKKLGVYILRPPAHDL